MMLRWLHREAPGQLRAQVIAGENDELMDAPAYKTAVEPLGAKVTLLPDVDHMGIVYQPAALGAIVTAAK
jgi:hypothetical protein